MLRRRFFLAGLALSTIFPAATQARLQPKLFVLRKGITSPILSFADKAPKREASLEGWLLCNGAEVSRVEYKELFEAMANAGPGNGVSTFSLPHFPCEYRTGDEPLRGIAICPSVKLQGFPPATLMPFNADANL
jgi:Phage Tail Collar Domain